MKLKDLFEFRAVPAVGPDASRPTPVSNVKTTPPDPEEYCKDRVWCEKKKKKDKKNETRRTT